MKQEVGECAPTKVLILSGEVRISGRMTGVLYIDVPSGKEDGNGWVIGESGDTERQLECSEFEDSFQSELLNLAPGNASFLRQLFSQPSCESLSQKKQKQKQKKKQNECDSRNPPGTKNRKALGVWEGPKLKLPRSLPFWFLNLYVVLGKFNPHVLGSFIANPSEYSFIRAIWCLRCLMCLLLLSFLKYKPLIAFFPTPSPNF